MVLRRVTEFQNGRGLGNMNSVMGRKNRHLGDLGPEVCGNGCYSILSLAVREVDRQ